MRCFGTPLDPRPNSASSNASGNRRARLFRRFLRSPLLRSELSTLSELRFSNTTSKISPNSSRYSADRLFSSSSCSQSTSSPAAPPTRSDHCVRSLSYSLDPAPPQFTATCRNDDGHTIPDKPTRGPPVVQVKAPRLHKDSVIYRRVQSFESLHRDSRRRFGPSLSELRHIRNKNGFVLVNSNGPYAEYTL